MSTLALGFVLVAALLHAMWNLAAKKAGGGSHFVLLCALLTVVLWAPVAIVVGQGSLLRWGALEWGCVLASGLTHLTYFRALLRGYRESDLTVVYAMARGTGSLLTALAAVLLLGERIGLVGVGGVLMRETASPGMMHFGTARRFSARRRPPGAPLAMPGPKICGACDHPSRLSSPSSTAKGAAARPRWRPISRRTVRMPGWQ